MAVSSSTMRLNTNDKKKYAAEPLGKKKDKKKKKKKHKAEPSGINGKVAYEQISPQSFVYDPQDWLEASDEYAFDDVQAMVQKALNNEYSGNGGGGDYPSSSGYYIYKLWPDKVACKRAYSNKDPEAPLFLLHEYDIEDGEAVLGDPMPVELGFVPAGSGDADFMTAVREVDAASVDDPDFNLDEEEGPDEDDDDPDEGELEDDDGDSDDDEYEDDDEVQEGELREDVANLAEQDFTEAFDAVMDNKSRIVEQVDKAGKVKGYIIENMAMLGGKSKNNRKYAPEVRKKAIKVFEGIKAYMNHPKKGDEDAPRQVQELIGRHHGVHFDESTDLLRSNLHLSPTHLVKEYLIPHAKANPGILGNSINASGKIDSKGNVLEITKGRSVDVVAEPATTQGLFEHVQNPKSSTSTQTSSEGGDNSMEKTLKEVLEDKELRDQLRSHFREELEVELSVGDLQEEVQELRETVKEFELEKEVRENEEAVDEMIESSKLSEAAKEDEEIRSILLEAKPERRPAILARFEKVQGSSKEDDNPKPSGAREKTISEGTGTDGKVERPKLVVAFRSGLVARSRR